MFTPDDRRVRRKKSIRKKVSGDGNRPRMTVFRSHKHIYAQVVDDATQKTLAATGSLSKKAKAEGTKTEDAKAVGKAIAEACLAKGIKKVAFDRNGYLYHGRVKALADAAREAGLTF